ncbi:MAG: MSCRAMM family protein [Methanothrix sp.]
MNIRTTQTDRNGHYSFCGLAPGQYRVCEEIRDGYIPVTHINHSSASCLPESCTCDACDNCIPVILDCSNSEGNDFENIPPLSIKGKVIDDCTGLALKGWTVKLYDDRGVQLTSRTTGADGSYTFTYSTSGGLKLKAGTLYSVCEVVKDGWTPVTYHANNTSRPMSNENCIPVFLD